MTYQEIASKASEVLGNYYIDPLSKNNSYYRGSYEGTKCRAEIWEFSNYQLWITHKNTDPLRAYRTRYGNNTLIIRLL